MSNKAAKLRHTPTQTANGNGSTYAYTYDVGEDYAVIDPERADSHGLARQEFRHWLIASSTTCSSSPMPS